MRTRRAGDRLHRFLARHVDPQTFADLIEPTIADLQHEVRLAEHDAGRRALALLRGYTAIARVLFRVGPHTTPALKSAPLLAGLSIAGAALMTWARVGSGDDSRLFVGAFLIPMFMAPLVLSRNGLAVSYWRLFVGCTAVALTSQGLDIGVYGVRAYLVYRTPPKFRLADLIDFIAVLVAFSAVVALAAWKPATGREPAARRLVLGLFFAGMTAALLFGARATWQQDAAPFVAAARLPFYIVVFGMFFAATAPPLLIVQRWISRPVPLAAIGAVLSPISIVAESYTDHQTPATCLQHFLQGPMSFAALHSPVIVGAAVLGWCLATRERLGVVPPLPPPPDLLSAHSIKESRL